MRKRYITGANRQGVFLSETDIMVIKYIWNHRLVTSKQISRYDQILTGSVYESVLNKLRRWTTHQVIVKHIFKYNRQPGLSFNYYRIGTLGKDILFEEGIISQKEYQMDVSSFSKVSNIAHWFTTQDIVSDIHNRLSSVSFKSLHPFKYLFRDRDKNDEIAIIPDWLFQKDNRFVSIETDTGTESPRVLDNKMEKYYTVALQNTEKEFHVVIALVDDSSNYFNMFHENRSRRIGNLKNQMLMRKYLTLDNLHVHIVQLKQAGDLISKIILGHLPIALESRTDEIYKVVEQIWSKLNKMFPYHVQACGDEIYPENMNSIYRADRCYWFFDKQNPQRKFRVLFVLMEEGNVKSLDRLQYLVSLQSASGSYQQPIERIVAVYQTNDELKRDIIGSKLDGVLFGSQEGWLQQLGEVPTCFETISPYKLGGCEFV